MFSLYGREANAPYIVDDGVQLISEPIASTDKYGVDETITVSVEFDRAVEVDTTDGAPVFIMYVGDSDNPQKEVEAQYARGSGTTTLEFDYGVGTGDRDSNGIYLARNLLRLRGGVIKEVSGDLPAVVQHPIVGNYSDHKIDDSLAAPFASLARLQLSGVDIRPEFRSDRTTYRADVHYDFTETTVVATPPEGGSVVIQPADADPDTDGHQVELMGEVEDDQDGDNVITATVSQDGHIPVPYTVVVKRPVRVVPKINAVSIVSTPHRGQVYRADEVIRYAVEFDHPVVVDITNGRPILKIDLKDPDCLSCPHELRDLKFTSGSGTDTLYFEYMVDIYDWEFGDDHLEQLLPANRLLLNGGTIRHAGNGVDADLSHRSLGRLHGHDVDGELSRPGIALLDGLSLSDVSLSPNFATDRIFYLGTPADGLQTTTVTATGAQHVFPEILPADAYADTAGHQVNLGDGITEIIITTTRLGYVSRTYTVRVAPDLVPDIDEVRLTSDPGPDGTYSAGDVISVEVDFDVSVQTNTSDGTPFVAISMGDDTREAAYSSIDTTNQVLTFSYTVVEDDSDQDGISIAANALSLDGGIIRGILSGADADPDHDAVPTQPDHLVNKIPSIVSDGVAVTSTPLAAADTYGKGETIAFTATFDSNVVVDTTGGTPTLVVDFWHPGIAGQTRDIPYVQGSGTSTLEFQYVVQSGDRDNTGIVLESDRLRLNGGSIRHETTGRDADLGHSRPNLGGAHKVDGRLDPPKAVLNSLSLSGATLSPAFDPAVTQYTATVTTDISQTTVAATVPVGHVGSIEPADADAITAGHQVALGTGPTEVSVEVTAAGRLAVSYHVTVTKSLARPDTPANLTATPGDQTATLAWVTPAALPGVSGHEYRYKLSSSPDYPESWTEIDDSAVGEDNEDGVTVGGLTNGVTYSFQVRAVNSEGASDPSADATALAGHGLGICNRTRGVQLAILATLSGVDDCADVTTTHLSGIASLTVTNAVSELKVGDFSGLTETSTLEILDNSDLLAVPSGIFGGLAALTTLRVSNNGITDLPAGVFAPVSALTHLYLSDNGLTDLPGGVFSGLSSLTNLDLDGNQLAELPGNVFAGLTSLTVLSLNDNRLADLPDGIFSGLSSLTNLELGGNATDPLLLPVAVEPSGNLQFKAVAPAGAPFDIVLPVSVADGSISGGATALTISAGTVESASATVTPASNGTLPTVSIGTLPDLPGQHSGYLLSRSSNVPLTLQDNRPVIENVALSSDAGSDKNYSAGDTVKAQVTFDVAVQVDTTGGTPTLSLTIGESSAVASYVGIDATGKLLTFQYTVGATDHDQDGISILANALSLDGGSISAQGSALPAILDHAAVSDQSNHRVNKDPEVVPGGVVIASSPLAASDTYGKGETISFTVTFDSNVVVDITGGVPTLSMEFWHPGRRPEYKELLYARGSGSRTLTFEYVIQQVDRDNTGIAVKRDQLRLNGGSIKHETTGRDARLEHPRPVFGAGHNVNGGLDPQRAELSTLSLSNVTLSPAFDPETTEYTAEAGSSVTQTTVTATALVGHIGGIEPADADSSATGHQVSVVTGTTLIQIRVMRAGRLTVTYTVTVSKAAVRPSRPTNLTATPGDETATLAWATPPASPPVTGHEYRYKSSSDADYPDAWTAIADSAAGEANAAGFTVDGLDNGVDYSFQVRAVNSEGRGDPSDELTVRVGEGLGICSRTRAVQIAILDELPDIQDCSDVTPEHLSTILDVWVQTADAELKADDFSGLTAMTNLQISSMGELTSLPASILTGLPELNRFTIDGSAIGELPEDIFAPATTLTAVHLYENQFTAVPEDLFSGLSLTALDLDGNGLTSLPGNVFDGLSDLTRLRLDQNQLTELPAGIFSDLSSLETLDLQNNRLTGLPSGIFDGLTALARLELHHNQLTSLPAGIIDDLAALDRLFLHENQLDELPAGMFAGVTSPLAELDLRDNATEPILLPVGLEAVGSFGFKAVAPTGAPFDFRLPLSVTDGSISGGSNAATISAGDVESSPLTVMPASNLTNPTAAITSLPGTPNRHYGYRLSLSSSTPLVLVDNRPRIQSIAIASDPGSDATYGVGDAMEVQVTFDKAVQVDTTQGTPHVTLTIGTATRNAQYARTESSGKALTFSYTVVVGDEDQDGVSISADALALNGGSITNRATGEDALLTHSALGDQNGHKVAGALDVAKLTALSLDGITLTPAFSPAVVHYTAMVGQDTTETTVSVTAETGAAATIQPVDADTATSGHQVSLSRGANEITITVSKSGSGTQTYTVTVNRIWAYVTDVTITSDPGADNVYVDDDVIEVSVTFGAPVAVDTANGTPYMNVKIGDVVTRAEYSSIDATNLVLTFTHTVASSDNDQDGIEIEANSLKLNGGTIRGRDTNLDAELTHGALDEDPHHLVNQVPQIIWLHGISVISDPLINGDTYGLGDTVVFTVTFNTKVVVDTTGGTPHLLIEVGDSDNPAADREFRYVHGSGTRTLEFEYVVQAGDRDSDGIQLHEDQLRLNGGSIRHSATGQSASSHYRLQGSVASYPAHKIDGRLSSRKLTACGAAVLDRKARLDICWNLGRPVPTGTDVVIETTRWFPWTWTDDYNLPVQEPPLNWKTIGRGDDYVACGGMDNCIMYSNSNLFRGAAMAYAMRIRQGDTVLYRSPRLRIQAPNWNDSPLLAELSGVLLPAGLMSYPDQVATGPFRTFLGLTDPEVSGVIVELVRDLELSDLEVTNGDVTAINIFSSGEYVITVVPTRLGEPVTISLPANRVTGVGEGLTAEGENIYTRGNTASNALTVETEVP